MTAPKLSANVLPAHKTLLCTVDPIRPLKKQLDSAFSLVIIRYEEKANKIRFRSLTLQAILVILSVVTTLFIGVKFQGWELYWLNVILLLCAIATGLWVFEIFKDYRSAWLNVFALQNSITRLHAEYLLVLACVIFLEKESLPGNCSLTAEQVHIQYWNELQFLLNIIEPAG